MRITGGRARGICLKSVDEKILRPATGYLRQAVFSCLGNCVTDCRFLDLFSGTGSYGLEALSRGANSGIFVERNSRIITILESNLAAVCKSIGVENENRIWNRDAFKIETKERFDLIFMDSPYALVRKQIGELLRLGSKLLRKGEGSRLIFEIPGDMELNLEINFQDFGLKELRRLGKKGRNSPAAVIYFWS